MNVDKKSIKKGLIEGFKLAAGIIFISAMAGYGPSLTPYYGVSNGLNALLECSFAIIGLGIYLGLLWGYYTIRSIKGR